jgi:hypothetical protein
MDSEQLAQKREEVQERIGYLECQAGWAGIIEECDRRLRELDPNYSIQQIKEKFGGLRYYASATDPAVDWDAWSAVIAEAERKAAETCETCGEPGKLSTTGYWLKTVCPKCYADWAKDTPGARYDLRANPIEI